MATEVLKRIRDVAGYHDIEDLQIPFRFSFKKLFASPLVSNALQCCIKKRRLLPLRHELKGLLSEWERVMEEKPLSVRFASQWVRNLGDDVGLHSGVLTYQTLFEDLDRNIDDIAGEDWHSVDRTYRNAITVLGVCIKVGNIDLTLEAVEHFLPVLRRTNHHVSIAGRASVIGNLAWTCLSKFGFEGFPPQLFDCLPEGDDIALWVQRCVKSNDLKSLCALAHRLPQHFVVLSRTGPFEFYQEALHGALIAGRVGVLCWLVRRGLTFRSWQGQKNFHRELVLALYRKMTLLHLFVRRVYLSRLLRGP